MAENRPLGLAEYRVGQEVQNAETGKRIWKATPLRLGESDPELWRRFHRFRKTISGRSNPASSILGDREFERRLAGESRSKIHHLYVIEDAGRVISAADISLYRHGQGGDSGRETVYADAYVMDGYRRRGIGTAWAALAHEAMVIHVRSRLICLISSDAGRAFMETLGATPISSFTSLHMRLDQLSGLAASEDPSALRGWSIHDMGAETRFEPATENTAGSLDTLRANAERNHLSLRDGSGLPHAELWIERDLLARRIQLSIDLPERQESRMNSIPMGAFRALLDVASRSISEGEGGFESLELQFLGGASKLRDRLIAAAKLDQHATRSHSVFELLDQDLDAYLSGTVQI